MSLMGTLAKVAIGVAVAKGAQSMMTKGRGTSSDGGLFGGAQSPRQMPQGTGLEDMMSDILGGKGQSGNGLGGLLESLAGESTSHGGTSSGGGIDDLVKDASRSGGLGDLIGSLTSGAGTGGLGGLLGSLAGAAGGSGSTGGFGQVLNQALEKRGEPAVDPTPEQEVVAGIMLRAMIQAAKSDGKIDMAERQKLLDKLGEVSQEEKEFVNRELAAPMDIAGLARQVPRGLEKQAYTMSVLGIDLDNQNEAQYLYDFATALHLDKQTVNSIHQKLGAPVLYR